MDARHAGVIHNIIRNKMHGVILLIYYSTRRYNKHVSGIHHKTHALIYPMLHILCIKCMHALCMIFLCVLKMHSMTTRTVVFKVNCAQRMWAYSRSAHSERARR